MRSDSSFLRLLCCPLLLCYRSINYYLFGCVGAYVSWLAGWLLSACGLCPRCVAFRDRSFPRTMNERHGEVRWRRAPELLADNNIDIEQGRVRLKLFPAAAALDARDVAQPGRPDAWLLSAFACLAEMRPAALRACFATRRHNARGRYSLRLYDAALSRWTTVVIDDTVPVAATTGPSDDADGAAGGAAGDGDDDEGTPLFLRPAGGAHGASSEVLWPLLLEKAVAKLCGGYDQLSDQLVEEGGHELWALQALTGAPVHSLTNVTKLGWVVHRLVRLPPQQKHWSGSAEAATGDAAAAAKKGEVALCRHPVKSIGGRLGLRRRGQTSPADGRGGGGGGASANPFRQQAALASAPATTGASAAAAAAAAAGQSGGVGHDDDAAFDLVRSYLRHGALVTACVGDGGVPIDGGGGGDGNGGTNGGGGAAQLPLSGQSYAIVDVRAVPNFHGRRRLCLVCVRNAWAANACGELSGEREQWEWRGAWSAGSDEWTTNRELARELSRAQASKLHHVASTATPAAHASTDGGGGGSGQAVGAAAWMAWGDFVRCFNSMHVCGSAASDGDASLRVDVWERDGRTHCAQRAAHPERIHLTISLPAPRPTPLCSAHPIAWRVAADAGPLLSCVYGCACFWCGCRGCRHLNREVEPTALQEAGMETAAEPDDESQIWLDRIEVRM